jgi:hypothetical protein
VSTKKPSNAKLTIGRRAQDSIGRQLRAMYEPLVQEPLPDGFLALLGAWKDAEAARYRVQHALERLRRTNRGFDVSAGSASCLKVHAQQMLVERAMRADLGRSSTTRAAGRGRHRVCEPVSDTFEPVSAFQPRKGFSGARDGGAETKKSRGKAPPETRKPKEATA